MDDHPSVKRLNKLSNINLIHLGNNSKHQQIFNDILCLLKIRLSEFPPDYNSKKCNDLLVYICNLIEELTKNDKKPNKKEIVLRLYKHLFNSDEKELNDLSATIDFICNNSLVNQIPKSKKLFQFIKKKKKIFINLKSYIKNNIINTCTQAVLTKYGMNAIQATVLIIECSHAINK